jgi:hypothetical protein
MKIAGPFIELRGDAAEGSGVEHPCGESELFEEGGETVHILLMILKGIPTIF